MMARTTVNDRNQAGAPEAPAPSPEGDDVKVDIEVEGDEKPEQTADAQQEEPQAVEAEVIEPDDAEGNAAADADEDDERARVEAAIKAGEAAAEQDFKSEADGLRAERDELAKKLASVSDDIEAAKAEAAASADRLSRLQADWENYRRRTERDRVTERERACEGLVKDLLPAIDDLERAIAHAQASAEGNDVAQQLADGVSAVHEKVVSVLEKQGVEVIDPAGQQARRSMRGSDLTLTISLTPEEAFKGTKRDVSYMVPSTGERAKLTVEVPAGAYDGMKLRYHDRGEYGSNGGPRGSLVITTSVAEHPLFKRDGADVRLELPVSIWDLALGASVKVPTPGGNTLKLRIPAGTQDGKTVRFRDLGAPNVKRRGTFGAMYVTVRAQIPTRLSAKEREALEALRDADERGYRKDVEKYFKA